MSIIRKMAESQFMGLAAQAVGPELADPVVGMLERTMMSPRRGAPPPTSDPKNLNQVEQQLRRGFLDAGKPGLARMVGRPSFDRWIGQESGWRPGAVSPANNQGQRNGGLFQFWYGHDFSDPYEGLNKFTMPVRLQAEMAATQFGLTPRDIRRYGREIRQGTYQGWG